MGHTRITILVFVISFWWAGQIPVMGIPSPMTPMKMAALYGDFETLRSLVENGASPNGELENGIAPLHLAAYHGHLKIVEYLISKGADVNLCRSDAHWYIGCTALSAAASVGQLGVMKILLDHGADVNHGGENGSCNAFNYTGNALMQAVRGGHIQAVDLLLEKGADPLKATLDGRTVLHFVRDPVTAAKMIDRGVPVDSEDPRGMTPLFVACMSDHSSVAELLVSRGAQPLTLHEGVYLELKDWIRELVEAGNPVDEIRFGFIPLEFARTRPIAELLVQLGAHINELKTEEVSPKPIYRPCIYGRTEVVEYFLDNGISMEDVAQYLDSSVRQGHLDLVKMCVKRGLDIKKYGPLLLSTAVSGNPEIARWLIQQGVDVNGSTGYNFTILGSAVRRGNRELVELLLKSGAKLRDDQDYLLYAIMDQYFELVPMLLERGAKVNGIGPNQRPLHTAVTMGNVETVRILLEHGADPTLSIPMGGTAMEIAQKWKKEKICRLLDEYAKKTVTPASPAQETLH